MCPKCQKHNPVKTQPTAVRRSKVKEPWELAQVDSTGKD
ncbi:hypothetical protein E2C01_081062 [Portunus trituberculatus]|uniref:Uncharacterized protein n=1 Tax=Portunus trituberculatus TaxID=210409 RepID=A0A5B7INU7_PORTR|nr:hypothetical protein [Portunus trituberculatus]